ncbi:TD and POZ domain-containing protein 3-like [Uloborus diversus]|uniref:TD and POZ domain-containing protein 3-like n=1 Tax=Uloborus diversus TaxID=327109 RepID=UPI0024099A9C|nr:TD and POZ domain-containing protein 3-like [Uloborus diversus]
MVKNVEQRCFNTSVEWKLRRVRGRESAVSPTFQCSSLSWNLNLYPYGYNYAMMPRIDLQLVGGISSSILIPYFKLIISDDKKRHKRILFEYTNENYVLSPERPIIQIEIHTIESETFVSKCPLTVSFYFIVEDQFPEATEMLKEIDEKSPVDGSTTGFLTKCGSRGCMSMCSDFEELYNKSRLSDVTLKLTKDEFQAHKVVLSARSKVFAAMFEHDTKENRTDTVDLVNMEVKTAQDMLRYMYCGKVRELSAEEALDLFVAADRYDLQELKSFCREVVLDGFSTNNVCDIAAVADLHNDETLIKKLKCFLFENGSEVIKTEKWKEVTAKNPSLGAKMFEWAFSK